MLLDFDLKMCHFLSIANAYVKQFCLILVIVTFSVISNAQTMKPKFGSSVSIGFLAGQQHNAFSTQWVNGLTFSHLFAGIGAGLDFYEMKSVPVFAAVRFYPDQKQRFFGYGNVGHNFVMKKKFKNSFSEDPAIRDGGFYTSLGVGYATPLNARWSLFFKAGYSYKRMSMLNTYTICPFIPPCYKQFEKYKYGYRRLEFSVGVGF